MEFTIMLLVLIGFIIFGLTQSTETVLDIRQRRRDQDDDPKVYL